MATIDVEKLLAEISPDAPCGEDMSYDRAYTELDQAAQGTPERQVGESIIAAQEPEWHKIADSALELLSRSRDLRLVLYATLAALKVDGLPGLRDGLAVLRGTIERYWDTVYPQLDPEDPDPIERVNIITALVQPESNFRDPMKLMRRVREVPLTDSRQVGRFSLRDIQIARGEIAAPSDPEKPQADLSQVEAALKDTETEYLQAVARAAKESAECVAAIDALLTERIGAGRAPDLSDLRKLLAELGKEVQVELESRGYGAPPTPEETAAVEAEAGAAPRQGAQQALSGEVRSAQDVLAALDRICRYYQLNEPSSPVPLILRRAQRLVSKSFVEIVQDMSPEALRQIELICGLDTGH